MRLTLTEVFRPLAAASFIGLSLAGCAVDRTREDGMRETGFTVGIAGKSEVNFDTTVGRANVLNNGLANQDPRVSQAAAQIICENNNGAGNREQTRMRWQVAAGEKPDITCGAPPKAGPTRRGLTQ